MKDGDGPSLTLRQIDAPGRLLSADRLQATGHSQRLEKQRNFDEGLARWPARKSLRQVFRMAMGFR